MPSNIGRLYLTANPNGREAYRILCGELVVGRYEVRVQHVSGGAGPANITVHAGNKWVIHNLLEVRPAANSNLKENQMFLCYVDVKIVTYGASKYFIFNIT